MQKTQTPYQNAFDVAASLKNASLMFESAVTRISSRQDSTGTRRRAFAHLLFSPIHYEPNYAYPLLVWLHGSGKTETELFDVAPKISTRNYVAVAPRGVSTPQTRLEVERVDGRLIEKSRKTEASFEWPETANGVSEAENLVFDSIEQAAAKHNINRRRIFLLGRGTGGTMAIRVALRNPREFAGVVSIDGAFPTLEHLPLRNWREARDLPILATTGGFGSTTAPQPSADRLRLFHTAGMTVVVRQYNDAPGDPVAAETRTKKILGDVNRWTMERALNPDAPISELFRKNSQK